MTRECMIIVKKLKMGVDDRNCLRENNAKLCDDLKIMKRDFSRLNTRHNNLRSKIK